MIFDHQVVFDSKKRTLWCFGGRIIASSRDVPLEEQRASPNNSRYSGLFNWRADNNQWTYIRQDLNFSRLKACFGCLAILVVGLSFNALKYCSSSFFRLPEMTYHFTGHRFEIEPNSFVHKIGKCLVRVLRVVSDLTLIGKV